jgi:cytosine/adenosine deaminase-related metal-dependent hydrolase
MKQKLLIRGGHVLSLDPEIGTIANCDILVEDDVIVEIKPGIEASETTTIDARGTVVIPGFVDTHRHLWQTVLRGTLPSCSISDYFGQVMFGWAPAFRAEDVYVGTLIGAYEALNAGVTTIVDWCNCTNTPEHADAAIRALQETHIRAMYGYGTPGGAEWIGASHRGHPDDASRVRSEYFAAENELLTFALALRGPGAVDEDVNRSDFELARELNARITVHSGVRIPGLPTNEIEILERGGLLGHDTTFVHCNTTSDADLRAIAEAGGTLSVSPYVEMLMGHGAPITGRALATGLRPSLSVDVTTSVPGDMFTQMRTAFAQERALELPVDDSVVFAPKLDALEVLRFATIDGARACGLDDRIGSLVPGKAADIVLIRADQINTLPSTDPVATVVTCADTANVDTVIVAGRLVKRHGKLLEANLPSLQAMAVDSQESVFTAVKENPPAAPAWQS